MKAKTEEEKELTPDGTAERDVQSKTKKLLQSQNYTEYTSVAHKIHKCVNKAEASREPAVLLGSLLGHSSRATKFKTLAQARSVTIGEEGWESAPSVLSAAQKATERMCIVLATKDAQNDAELIAAMWNKSNTVSAQPQRSSSPAFNPSSIVEIERKLLLIQMGISGRKMDADKWSKVLFFFFLNEKKSFEGNK